MAIELFPVLANRNFTLRVANCKVEDERAWKDFTKQAVNDRPMYPGLTCFLMIEDS
jgi:hypothetical protein